VKKDCYVRECKKQGQQLVAVTGKKPRFYRSGIDFYDEVAVAIANNLGYQVISYSVLGDAGATYNREQISLAILDFKVVFSFTSYNCNWHFTWYPASSENNTGRVYGAF
jgi:hypothetical protein